MINIDAKLISKCVAARIKRVLPSLIHENQVAYIKGRNIFDAIRLIDDLVQVTDIYEIPGLQLGIDFTKAFDSLNREYLYSVLNKCKFGPVIQKWVETFYKNINACVINNGITTNYFPVEKGVRQGDPLSPYLFILCLETVAEFIRSNENIKGIYFGKPCFKLNIYADDMTVFLADLESLTLLLKVMEIFGDLSGLRINLEKTELFWLGPWKTKKEFPKGLALATAGIKILGIYFSYNKRLKYENNFTRALKKMENSVKCVS